MRRISGVTRKLKVVRNNVGGVAHVLDSFSILHVLYVHKTNMQDCLHEDIFISCYVGGSDVPLFWLLFCVRSILERIIQLIRIFMLSLL